MKVTNAAARLARLGDESSGIWKKARESVDTMAAVLMKYARAAGIEGEEFSLPRRYRFACWPSREWKLTRARAPLELVDNSIQLSESSKPQEYLIRFAWDIATGWLDETVQLLEEETAKLKRLTTSQVQETLKAAKV